MPLAPPPQVITPLPNQNVSEYANVSGLIAEGALKPGEPISAPTPLAITLAYPPGEGGAPASSG